MDQPSIVEFVLCDIDQIHWGPADVGPPPHGTRDKNRNQSDTLSSKIENECLAAGANITREDYEKEKRDVKYWDAGYDQVISHFVNFVFPAAATLAASACLKLVQPLLLQWMKNKASRSVHVKIKDIDIYVRGGDDIEKALRILEGLQTQSSPAEPPPPARKKLTRRKQK
jgi:hypothetical protein